MSTFISRNLTSLVILLSIALGFLLPDIGLIWKSYLAFLLALLMFFAALSIEPKDITESFRSIHLVALALFMVFVFTPALALPAKLLFSSPIVFAGITLAFCAPSAIATAFWTKVFKGDVAFALVISVLANLLSIITMPLTMLIATGQNVTVDFRWMILNLAEVILVPITAAFTLKRAKRFNWKRVTGFGSKIELVILIMLIWASIAQGASLIRSNLWEFAWLNTYMIATLAIAFATAYLLGKRSGHKRAVTMGIAACVKNAALALVIGVTLYGSEILPPLIANLIGQNLLIVPLQLLVKEK